MTNTLLIHTALNRSRFNPFAKMGAFAALAFLTASCAIAQNYPTYTDLHDFGPKVVGPTGALQYDGYFSRAGVTFDSHGNMYGTTEDGGTFNQGVVWELSSTGVYTVLHNFGGTILNANGQTGPDGDQVGSNVTVDASGNIYGTTSVGSLHNGGNVWEITTAGAYVDLHDFGGFIPQPGGGNARDGSGPLAPVSFDGNGNMYGTTSGGGSQAGGQIWEITSGGTYMDLHDFGGTTLNANGVEGADGSTSYSSVAIDASGNLYGTTALGGRLDAGVLWTINTATGYADLHDFGGTVVLASGSMGPDGQSPYAGVVVDAAGAVYGAVQEGGPYNFSGMVFKYSVGVYTDLHDFGGGVINANGVFGGDGFAPFAAPTLDSAGNLYGTTTARANTGYPKEGIVWEITNGGVYEDLWDFGNSNVSNVDGKFGQDGYIPYGNVTFDQYGNLYGATARGGINPTAFGGQGGGIIWTIGSVKSLTLATSSVYAGVKATGTITLGRPAPIGGVEILLNSSDPNISVPSYVKVPAGSSVVNFTVETARTSTVVNGTITATQGNTNLTAPLTVNPVTLSGFSYFAAPIGGSTLNMAIDLDGPAPAGGLTVNLTSNSAKATVQASVFVPAGSTQALFPVTYSTVASNTPVIISGTLGAQSVTANVTIKP